jgi:hypothetical protein
LARVEEVLMRRLFAEQFTVERDHPAEARSTAVYDEEQSLTLDEHGAVFVERRTAVAGAGGALGTETDTNAVDYEGPDKDAFLDDEV